jgi:hypothetical protein
MRSGGKDFDTIQIGAIELARRCLLVSPCRPCSDAWTQKNPPRPPARPARNPASAASHPANVVPRRPRKTESSNQINNFQKPGVEVESGSIVLTDLGKFYFQLARNRRI